MCCSVVLLSFALSTLLCIVNFFDYELIIELLFCELPLDTFLDPKTAFRRDSSTATDDDAAFDTLPF